jgi:raffinose/stachyose/melibiose transport system permease protein
MTAKVNVVHKEYAVKKHLYLLMIVPALVVYTLFAAYPFISSLSLSFFDWGGVGPKKFIGLQNYQMILHGILSQEFYRAVVHNAIYFIGTWALTIIPGLFFAFLLNSGLKGTNIFKIIFFFPNVLPIIVIGFLFSLLLNPQWGPINAFWRGIGLDQLVRPWLGDVKFAFPTIIVISSWKMLGFYILVFLAAMLSVGKDQIEAARLDGASEMHIGWSIVLPHIFPTVVTLSILKFIGAFNVFDIVYAMEGTQAGPAGATDVLGTLFYDSHSGAGKYVMGMGWARPSYLSSSSSYSALYSLRIHTDRRMGGIE